MARIADRSRKRLEPAVVVPRTYMRFRELEGIFPMIITLKQSMFSKVGGRLVATKSRGRYFHCSAEALLEMMSNVTVPDSAREERI